MGHLHTPVTVSGDTSTTVRMLVDTGTTYSVIPKALARAVGIAPLRQLLMTLADGRRKKLAVGTAVFRIGHREAPTTVLVTDVLEPILGVEALDVLGLTVDLSKRKLTPSRRYTV